MLNGHVHIYSRFYLFSNLTFATSNATTVTGTGQGSYFQIIGGHSGTDHFFPGQNQTSNYELPFVANVNLLGASYCLLNFSGTNLEFSLIDSASGLALDRVTLTVPPNNNGNNNSFWSPRTIVLLATGACILLAAIGFLIGRFRVASKILGGQPGDASKPAKIPDGLEHFKARQVGY